MKYYATGERIDYDGVTLLVTPTPYNNAVCTHNLACTKNKRKDKRHVVFIKVNE